MQALEDIKYYMLRFAQKKDVTNYVDLGFFIIHGIGRVYFVVFLIMNRVEITAYLRHFKSDKSSKENYKVYKFFGAFGGL